ncbi:unannotated protein [freshwater metagenome]|uniref:Unannotated protein n=1 Tax=freshwater metagenome TaxID=449393 RepID=A0A6J7FAL6_9ZZZZ
MRCAEDVADDPAHAGVGATEGFDGRRVVVCLAFQCVGAGRRELHDACVAIEGRHHERRGDGVGGLAQLIEQWRQHRAVREHDVGTEALVRAVFAPGLGQRLELGVGGRPSGGVEVGTDHVQLGEIQGEAAFDAELAEPVVVAG